jgi:hypothetical protein
MMQLHFAILAKWRKTVSIIEKVRVPRLPKPEPTPKERLAWVNFLALVEEYQGKGESMSLLVIAELERLIAKGNPLAIRFQEKRRRPTTNHVQRMKSPCPHRPRDESRDCNGESRNQGNRDIHRLLKFSAQVMDNEERISGYVAFAANDPAVGTRKCGTIEKRQRFLL